MDYDWWLETSRGKKMSVNAMSRELHSTSISPSVLPKGKSSSFAASSSSSSSSYSSVIPHYEIRRYEAEIAAPVSNSSITREEFEKIKDKVAERQKDISGLMRLLAAAEKVYICFLVDCTGSMDSYIEAVKDSVTGLAQRLSSAHANLSLQLAFVRYTDYDQPANSRTTYLNFTSSLSKFESFVSKITAKGGSDGPEDVFGGLNTCLTKLSWGTTNNTNVLIHIADAPCHGSKYHSMYDEYPRGDPAGIKPRDLLEMVEDLKINYWFGKINDSTDKMIKVLNSIYDNFSDNSIKVFEALDDEDEISKQVSSIASESVSATMLAATTSDLTLRSYDIDKRIPNWDKIRAYKATQYKFLHPDLKSLKAMDGTVAHEKVTVWIKVAPNPFAEGALRLAYIAREYPNENLNDSESKLIVVKQNKYLGPGANSRRGYFEDMEAAAAAASMSLMFKNVSPKSELKFAVSKVLQFKQDPLNPGRSYGCYCFAAETYISGHYEKFNSNSGWVADSDHAEYFGAFSHWTYVYSDGKLMVVDLQGVKNEKGIILTDPAIHSVNLHRFGKTNLGQKGMVRFFKTHVCGPTCRKLKLSPVTLY